MKVKYTIWLILTFFSFNINYSYSQEPTGQNLYDMDLEALMYVKVKTSSKIEQSLSESPASMVVITEQMIKERGYHHLEEILHDLPGFDFNKNFGVNYSTIFMRGYRSSNSDRFILLFDGINENDIWKQTTWNTTSFAKQKSPKN